MSLSVVFTQLNRHLSPAVPYNWRVSGRIPLIQSEHEASRRTRPSLVEGSFLRDPSTAGSIQPCILHEQLGHYGARSKGMVLNRLFSRWYHNSDTSKVNNNVVNVCQTSGANTYLFFMPLSW